MYNKVQFPALESTNTSLLLFCSHWENLLAASFLFNRCGMVGGTEYANADSIC